MRDRLRSVPRKVDEGASVLRDDRGTGLYVLGVAGCLYLNIASILERGACNALA